MLGEAKDEIAKSNALWENEIYKALREQQENDYGLSGPYKFEMPQSEGNWDSVTTNLFKVTANKVIGLLTASWRQLFIDVDDDTRKKREVISKTERLANGLIYQSDRATTAVPSGKDIQSALVAFACTMGGTAKSVLLTENEDGLVIPKIPVYNPMQCQWEEGEGELTWFCYRDSMQESYFKKRYKKQIEDGFAYEVSSEKLVQTYTFWDEQKWKLACGTEYIDEGEHGLGYLPINIRTVGAMPPIQTENYKTDVLKHAWQSIFANDRDLADIESRLLSIGSSIAKESGKIKVIGEKDSSKDPGDSMSEELAKAGFTASSKRTQIILLDAGKGGKFGGLVPPPTMEAVDKFRAIIRGMAIIGMIDPIAFGQMTRSGSGALAAELRAAALEFINPFKKCVQDDFIWIAEESVRQFKNAGFEKVEVEGRDAKRTKFYADISAKDVEEKRFDCNLVPDRLRDETMETGLAVQKVQYGLSSKKTAMLRHNLVEDADREQDIMTEEMAKTDPVYVYSKLAEQFHKEKDDQMALYYQSLAAIQINKVVSQAGAMGLIPGQAPKPPGITPQAQTGAMQAENAFVPPGRNEGTEEMMQ